MEVHLLLLGNNWLQTFRKKMLSRQQWYDNFVHVYPCNYFSVFSIELFASLDYNSGVKYGSILS